MPRIHDILMGFLGIPVGSYVISRILWDYRFFFDFDGILVGVILDFLGFDCFLNGNLIGYNYITFLILMEYWFVASGVLSCCMGKSSNYMGHFPASHVRLPEGEATTNP